MQKSDLDKVKGKHSIYTNGDYVVLAGKKLWIFKTDGRLISCRNDISNVHKVAFLPGNRMLTCGGKGASYRLLSLEDGGEIWNIPPIKKIDLDLGNFAISPDKSTVYDYYTWRNEYYLVTINIQSGSMDVCYLQPGLRATHGIICDDDGVPCLLQTHYEEIGGQRVSQNGIRYHYTDEISPGSAYHWKYKWQHTGATIAEFFLDSTELILTNDLYVYTPKNGEMYFLLENDPEWVTPGYGPGRCWFDKNKQYLIVMYDNVNVVIDWNERKMVARYVMGHMQGCLIGNEFWVSSEAGIHRKPFPLIEDIPPRKLTTLFPAK